MIPTPKSTPKSAVRLALALALLLAPSAVPFADAQEASAPEATAAAAPEATAAAPEIQLPGPLAMIAAFTRAQLQIQGFQRYSAEIAGHPLVWWQKGDGPTVVLLHGVNDQAGTWLPAAPALAESHRVLLVDLPGHGESGPAAGTPLTMSTIVDGFLAWFLEHRVTSSSLGDAAPEAAPPILVGNSMGAWVAFVAAHRHPTAVSRVVAINGGPLAPDNDGVDLLPANREEAQQLLAALRDPASPAVPDNLVDDLVRQAATSQARRILQHPEDLDAHLLTGKLGEINTPVDLLWGTSDRFMGESFPQRLLDGLPHARLTALKACGHVPQAECPQALAQGLIEVLASAPPGTDPNTEAESDSKAETESHPSPATP